MLVGKRHRIIRHLTPIGKATEFAIRLAYQNVSSPTLNNAIDTRDAILNIQAEIDKVVFYMAKRAEKRKI